MLLQFHKYSKWLLLSAAGVELHVHISRDSALLLIRNSKIKGEKNKRKGKKYKRTEIDLEKEQVKEKEKSFREGNDREKANGIKKGKNLKICL